MIIIISIPFNFIVPHFFSLNLFSNCSLLVYPIYHKSSIKPRGAYFFQALLRGALIERGGGLKREGGLFNLAKRTPVAKIQWYETE